MHIDSITAQNFLSVGKEPVTINLKDQGLVLIIGQNKDSTAQDDNGSGKSALVRDLPLYGLFGVCARGITPGRAKGWSGDQVVNNRTKKNLLVETNIVADDGIKYMIRRYRKHHKFNNLVQLFRDDIEITGHDAKSTQVMIDQLLGLDYETALNTLVFGQDLLRFFAAATDREQKELFERIVELGCWADAQKVAAEQAATISQSIAKLESEIQTKRNRLVVLNDELVDYTAKEKVFAQEHAAELAEVTDVRDTTQIRIDEIVVEQTKKRKAAATLSTRIDSEKSECIALLESTQVKLESLRDIRTAVVVKTNAVERDAIRVEEILIEQSELSDKQKALSNTRQDNENCVAEIDATTHRIAIVRKDRDSTAAVKGASEKEIVRLTAVKENLEDNDVGSTCPTCGQIIVAGGSDACVLAIDKDIIKEQRHLCSVKVDLGRLNSQIVKMEKLLQGIQKQKQVVAEEMGQLVVLKDSVNKINNEYKRILDGNKGQPAFNGRSKVADLDSQIADMNTTLCGLQEQKEAIAEAVGRLSVIDTALESLASEYNRAIQDINRYEDRIQKLKDTKSPYADLCATRQTEIDVVTTILDELAEDLISEREIFTYVNWWKTGFGNSGIKSLLLRSLTPILNAKANEYAQALMDGEIVIQFQTQTKLKSGEWRDKFQITAVNSNGADIYLGNSGGERRRVDVCIALALCQLLRCRRSKQIRLFVADELFESLDSTGVGRMIQLSHDLADEIGTFLVISHQPEVQNRFNKIWTIVKQNGFSHLELN